jgi:hypothetical protein
MYTFGSMTFDNSLQEEELTYFSYAGSFLGQELLLACVMCFFGFGSNTEEMNRKSFSICLSA